MLLGAPKKFFLAPKILFGLISPLWGGGAVAQCVKEEGEHNRVCKKWQFREDFNKKKTVKRMTLSLLGLEPTYPT